MSLIAHPEVLRRRRIWDEKEFIDPQHGRRKPEEAEVERQLMIKEGIAKREREHQLHLAQFQSEKIYSTDETHIVFILSILLVCLMLIIYPWQSTPIRWKAEHYVDGKNGTITSTLTDASGWMKQTKSPPLPRPSPVPYPRRLNTRWMLFNKPPKSLPAPAKAIPIVGSKKDLELVAKDEEEKKRLQNNQLRPTQSTDQIPSNELKPPSPTQTQGSDDWMYTLSRKVSKRLHKGQKNFN